MRARLATIGVAVALVAIPGVVFAAAMTARRPPVAGTAGRQARPVRDRYWVADIAYLARELPLVHVDGLTNVSRAAWGAAARRLERRVPRLTDGRVIAGLARMVALLRDDETQLILPPSAIFPFAGRMIGNGVYLIAVPTADRWSLGARLVAVDGRPIQQVLARLRAEIDYQDPGVARGWEVDWDHVGPDDPGYLNNANLLHWLGITRTATAADFTVRVASAGRRTIRLTAVGRDGGSVPPISYVPLPLYRQNRSDPYWIRILPGRRAVYLKYNQCLPGRGFQRVAARAIAALLEHPRYRLVVDLRNNPGGDSQPFRALIDAIRAHPAINRRGRIFGLVNDFTASSATLDSSQLRRSTNAILVGQAVSDPIDEFGNDDRLLTLPHSRVHIQVTTAVVNPTHTRYGIPDIGVAPTVRDWLAGRDPVLSAALVQDRG